MPFDPGLGSATKSCTGPFQDTTVLADPLSDEDLRDLRGLRVGPNSDGLQPIEAMASNLLEGCAEPNTRSERFSRSCGSTSLRLPGVTWFDAPTTGETYGTCGAGLTGCATRLPLML